MGGHGLCHQFDHTPQVKSFSSGLFESDFESLSCDLWCTSQAEKLEAFLGNVECCRTNLEAGAAACPGPTLLLHYSCSGHYSCNARTVNISRPLVHFLSTRVNITRTLLQQWTKLVHLHNTTVNVTFAFLPQWTQLFHSHSTTANNTCALAQQWTLPVTCDDSLMNNCALNVHVLNVVVPLMSLSCAYAEHYLWVKVI